MSDHICARRTLARGTAGSIELCRCGTIHLMMGPLTLRLDPASCEALWATLGEALHELRALRERRLVPGLEGTAGPAASERARRAS